MQATKEWRRLDSRWSTVAIALPGLLAGFSCNLSALTCTSVSQVELPARKNGAGSVLLQLSVAVRGSPGFDSQIESQIQSCGVPLTRLGALN